MLLPGITILECDAVTTTKQLLQLDVAPNTLYISTTGGNPLVTTLANSDIPPRNAEQVRYAKCFSVDEVLATAQATDPRAVQLVVLEDCGVLVRSGETTTQQLVDMVGALRLFAHAWIADPSKTCHPFLSYFGPTLDPMTRVVTYDVK